MVPKKAAVKRAGTPQKKEISPWDRVQLARHPMRPMMLDYVASCFEEFIELHGDRHIGDDAAMPVGLATILGQRCVVVGHEKGRETKEKLRRNFGSANPEGYRKALRVMKLAEKFSMPVVAIIDTPGAYPGIGAEERNIAEAIACNLKEMMLLRTPIVAVIIGEGGSGGALGIGVADRVMIMENAYYSVISPEGCAAILWKDRNHAQEAAEAMKLDAENLKRLEIVDEIVPEPEKGAHADPALAADYLKAAIVKNLKELTDFPIDEIISRRYKKFRCMGRFNEGES